MTFDPPLIPVRFLRRYQRFLADVEDGQGRVLTVHVPNPGRMTSCLGEGWPALISESGRPARRLPHTLEMLHNGESWIGVQTLRANGLALEALQSGLLPGLETGWQWSREQRHGGSRLDLLGRREDGERIWIEVKSVTLRLEDGCAAFPDAVTARGLRHLEELCACRAAGERALLLLVVQRQDVDSFRPAAEVDPAWAAGLRRAAAQGVEVAALRVALSPQELRPVGLLPVQL